MIQNLERYLDHLDVIREDLLPLLVVELEREGLIAVERLNKAETHLNVQGEPYEEKSNKEAN